MTSLNKTKKMVLAVAAVVVVAIVGAGVLLTRHEATNQDSVATVQPARVTIAPTVMPLTTLTVQKGQSIVWENADNQPRLLQLTSSENTIHPIENQIGQGETYSYVFDKAGTFNYYDGNDPTKMSGVIVVE